MEQAFQRLTANRPLSTRNLAGLESEFQLGYRRASAEAVERVTGGRPTCVEFSISLGALGSFYFLLDEDEEVDHRKADYKRYFGTTEAGVRPGSRVRGVYLNGEIAETAQPVRLIRLPEGEFHVFPLDLSPPPSSRRRIDEDGE